MDNHAFIDELSYQSVNVSILDSTISTNDDIKSMAVDLKTPAICMAKIQTAGRGRNNKKWHSPECGNLYLSYKFQTEQLKETLSLLSLRVGLMGIEMLKHFYPNEPFKIKWPNDIYLMDKKLAGILIETASGLKGHEVIIGFGINCQMQKGDLSPNWISLNQLNGITPSWLQLAIDLVNAFNEKLIVNKVWDKEAFFQKWQQYDYLLGKKCTIFNSGEKISGEVLGINQDGALRFQLASGDIKDIYSGELHWPEKK